LPHNYHKLTAPLLPPLLHAHQPCSLQPGSPRQHLRFHPLATNTKCRFSILA
jgi:hypothetical protein